MFSLAQAMFLIYPYWNVNMDFCIWIDRKKNVSNLSILECKSPVAGVAVGFTAGF